MPAIAPVVLNDGTVDVTYTPYASTSQSAEYKNSANGARALSNQLKINTRTQANAARRTNAKLEIPILRDVDGVSTQVDVIIMELNVRSPAIATTVERTKVREQLERLAAHAVMVGLVDNEEGFWG